MRCDPQAQTPRPMHSHPNARLTQKGRLRLINRHLLHHRPLAEQEAEAGISKRCAYKWLARYRSGGAAALMDRRSVRRTQPGDARSTAPPASPRATPSAAAPTPHRQAAGRSLLHRGQDPEPPGPGAVAKPGPQGTDATLRARHTGRPNSHRRQKAGPLPPGRTSHHRQSAAGTLHGRRL